MSIIPVNQRYISPKNLFILFFITLLVLYVYFYSTNRVIFSIYVFYFAGLFFFSFLPLSYIAHRKKIKFKCIKCGECCKLKVKLIKSDVKRFEKAGINWKEFIDDNWNLKKIKGYCIFLKEEGGKKICTIYKHRPSVCRKWPFFSNPFSIHWYVFLICPSLRNLISK